MASSTLLILSSSYLPAEGRLLKSRDGCGCAAQIATGFAENLSGGYPHDVATELPTGTLTGLLRDARSGGPAALDRVFGHVQRDLRRLAQDMIATAEWPSKSPGKAPNSSIWRARLRSRGTPGRRPPSLLLLGRAMHDVLVEEARRAADGQLRGAAAKACPLWSSPWMGATRGPASWTFTMRCGVRVLDLARCDTGTFGSSAGGIAESAAEIAPAPQPPAATDYAAWLAERLAADR